MLWFIMKHIILYLLVLKISVSYSQDTINFKQLIDSAIVNYQWSVAKLDSSFNGPIAFDTCFVKHEGLKLCGTGISIDLYKESKNEPDSVWSLMDMPYGPDEIKNSDTLLIKSQRKNTVYFLVTYEVFQRTESWYGLQLINTQTLTPELSILKIYQPFKRFVFPPIQEQKQIIREYYKKQTITPK